MLFVRSFRSDWRHVTYVTMCRVVTKQLDGLNSRAIRPIPAAVFLCGTKKWHFKKGEGPQTSNKAREICEIILDSTSNQMFATKQLSGQQRIACSRLTSQFGIVIRAR
jgi:hypothetical protein